MRLSDLLQPGEPGPAELEITGITADSREVAPGMLFAALPGIRADGARFVGQAIERGAVAVLAGADAQIETPPLVPLIRAANPRARLAQFAAAFYAPQPETVVAVTGTNGKTSVACFTEQIWNASGLSAASIGTLGVSRPGVGSKVALTSPDPVTLHATLRELATSGVSHVALEASSHGLAQYRLDGLRLAAGAFTNISRDHLDYHPSFEDYFEAKKRLFTSLLRPGSRAVVNVDGSGSEAVLKAARARGLNVTTVGRRATDVTVTELRPDEGGLKLVVVVEGRVRRLSIPLFGGFQAENALVAAGLAAAVDDVALDDAVSCLEGLKGARGRLERVARTENGASVYVDYAHTPDGLATALAALRPHTAGRLIVVFGAGGDRDPGKRPQMGQAASRFADQAIVTDDNPRSEDPAAIRSQVAAGAAGAKEIGDRRCAIAEAVAGLGPGDVLLVAGKGHETGQIVGDKVLPFSDHDVIRDLVGSWPE